MTIYNRGNHVRWTCDCCGWYVVVNRGGFGDVVGVNTILKAVLNSTGTSCPACGSTKMNDLPASIAETYSLKEYTRRLRYALFQRRGRKEH